MLSPYVVGKRALYSYFPRALFTLYKFQHSNWHMPITRLEYPTCPSLSIKMRPKIQRHICADSCARFSLFKPNGVPSADLVKIEIEADEFEAIRLVDIEGLSQQDGAQQMRVSRQTFANILKKSRLKISTALINGYALVLPEKVVPSSD